MQDYLKPQPIDLTDELAEVQGVRFDPEDIVLLGSYGDELSRHRARKNWTQILESSFLLDADHDYFFTATSDRDNQHYALQCKFMTACGRYAFWRLINNQAPEAQYMIETAHIPNAELREADFIEAPDLQPVSRFVFGEPINDESRGNQKGSIIDILESAIEKVKELCKKL